MPECSSLGIMQWEYHGLKKGVEGFQSMTGISDEV